MSGSSSISKSLPVAVSRVVDEWIGRQVTLNAPSKLNLRLKVEGRRPDGYHLLSMINCSTSLQDTLRVGFTREDACVVTAKPEGSIPPGDGENLVSKAFRFFWSEFGFDVVPFGFRCEIKKISPLEAVWEVEAPMLPLCSGISSPFLALACGNRSISLRMTCTAV